MTRNRKIDPEVLEREYIYDSATPPVSFSALAARHGLARNTVAEKGVKGRWFERREEFRKQLGVKASEQLGEQWVRYETAMREKLLAVGMTVIERYEQNFDDPEFKVSTRDMLGVAAMLRTFATDATAAKASGEEELLDEDQPLSADSFRRALAVVERLEAGPAPAAAEAGSAGSGEG